MNKVVISLAHLFLAILLIGPGPAQAQDQSTLLASTNRGELVEIDLTAGTTRLIGTEPSPGGWSDLAMDAAGNLYTVSRQSAETASVCYGIFGFGPCAHLYLLDPDTGAVLQEIGDLQTAFVSDIDFSRDGTLYGSRFVDQIVDDTGGMILIDPTNATVSTPPNLRYGQGSSKPDGIDLANGGLAVHPLTGELWGIESGFSEEASIFKIDPNSGLGSDVVRLGLNGQPTESGFDSLVILPNGRFIATEAVGSNNVYEINPTPDAISGLAETTLIPLVLDTGLRGNLNGLVSLSLTQTVVIDIRPGDKKNKIRPGSRGWTSVAIMGSESFLAPQTIISTVRFGPDGAKAIPWLYFARDINRDGFADLILFFKTRKTGIECGDTEATISGDTHLGVTFVGMDTIKTVRCR